MGAVTSKRAIDVFVGSVLLLSLAPVIILAAIASLVSFRALPFFVQERIGYLGALIRIVKIRTLSPQTPTYALKHAGFPPGRTSNGVMTFVRKGHIDELPQLWSVITGSLSLVGPRPKMPDRFEPVPEEYGRFRVRVPQGCTGLWQIGGHTSALPHEHPEYDRLYISATSTRLDMWILWMTALQALGLKGPVELNRLPSWVHR